MLSPSPLLKGTIKTCSRRSAGHAGPSYGPMSGIWRKERCPAKRRPGRECPAWVPSLPGKGPTGKGWGPRVSSSPRASLPGRGTAAELYLHNASTFSPGVTCGAIRSRPLRRRSWCAPLRLRAGRAPDTADAGQPRSGGDLALPRRTPGGRAPRRAGSRPPSFFPSKQVRGLE